MKRRTAIIFYILSVYVVVQFIWWGYHLIELTEEVSRESEIVSKRIIMIMGEGAVFLLLLIIGIWQIQKSIKKELKLTERQNNFLLSVTHELKTPLASNKLYLQTITKRELDKAQQKQLIQKAIEENTRLERMIDNILNASRLENNALRLEKEKFNLAKLQHQVADRFNAFRDQPIVKVVCPDDLQISADRFMIETILNNLVENAIKYAGADNEIIIYGRMLEGKTEFGVKDQGPGIDKNARQDIFKKFMRLGNEDNRAQKGSGLGLFIVYELVKLHHAQIICIENSPKGANFMITFN